MKEVKFRFWSNYFKTYKEVYMINFKQARVYIELNKKGVPMGYHHLDDGVLEMFTGLKDKNGVEIYEGDTFKYNEELWKVSFNGGSFVMANLTQPNSNFHLLDNVAYFIEVTGNIHLKD